jgi:hypothetical protein
MKKIQFFLSLAAFSLVLFLVSCKKETTSEDALTAPEITSQQGRFSKTITLTNGENWMKVRLGCDDEALLGQLPELSLLTETPQAVAANGPSNAAELAPLTDARRLTFEVLEEHAVDGTPLFIQVVAPTGVQDRAAWWFSPSSNCGFGWRVWRSSSSPTFSVWHYTGSNCNYPMTYQTGIGGRTYYSTGYFWGAKNRIDVLFSGTLCYQHGQFGAAHW